MDLDGRPYKLASNGAMTTVRLTLAFAGSVRKQMRVCMVSNSRITPEEFQYYFTRAGKYSNFIFYSYLEIHTVTF